MFGVMFVLCTATVATAGSKEAEENNSPGNKQSLDDLLRRVVQNSEQGLQKSKELETRIRAASEARQKEDEAWHQQDEETWYSVSGKNFVVTAVGKSFSKAILAKADEFRREIALAWFGQELPQGKHVALIHVTLAEDKDKDEGLTRLGGLAKGLRGDHRIWLETTRELALSSTLAHEIAHVVLDARFPAGMPPWAREGTGSLLDDQERVATRQTILAQSAQSGQWPSLARLLGAAKIPSADQVSYAAAVSVTEFLLSRDDHAKFLDFVDNGSQVGWDKALNQFYGIDGTAELQKQWQDWVRRGLPSRNVRPVK